MDNLRKLTILGVTLSLILWSVGLSLPVAQAATIVDGDLVRVAGQKAVYYIQGSTARVFPHQAVYHSWGFPADYSTVKIITAAELAAYSIGNPMPFRDGSLFRGVTSSLYGRPTPTVFYVENATLRPIISGAVYKALFNDLTYSRVVWVPSDLLDKFAYPMGSTIESSATYPAGLFVKYGDRYGLTTATGVRYFADDAAITANRYNKAKAVTITTALPEGTPITGLETALVTPGWTTTATGPLTVSLAADTPAAATVPYGATSVPVLKFNISGSGTINEIVIKRSGVGSASDFTAAYLYDGYTRLTNARSISSETNEVTFINLNLSAPRTLTVKVDITNSNLNGHQSTFSVKSVNGTAVSGVNGNPVTISSVQATAATIAETGSAWTVTLGTSSAEVAKFSIQETSGSADLRVNAITLRNGGSLSNAYLQNLVLKTGSTILATASAMTGDKAVLVFSSPLTILKGQTKQFVLYADIRGGRTNDTIKFYLDETSDLNAVDATYGYGVRLTNNWALADQTVTMTGGTITLGFNGPVASNYAKNTTGNDFLKFSLSAERNVTVKKVKLTMLILDNTGAELASDNAHWGYLKNIKITDLDTGTTLVGPLSAASSGTYTNPAGSGNAYYYYEFSDSFDLTAGSTRHLSIKADIDANFTADYTIKFGLDLSGTNYVYDNDSGEYVSSSKIVPNTLTGNTMTVKEASLTVSKLSSPTSATYVKGTSDVPVLGVGLTAVADTLKVNKITVRLYADDDGTFDNSGYGDTAANTLASTVSLYEGTTKVAGPVNMTLVGTIGSTGGYYKAEFNNLAYTVSQGSTKNLTVKVNLLSTFTGTKYLAADIKPDDDMEVEDSQSNLLTNLSNTNLNLAASPSPVITCVENGTLTAAVDSSTPSASLVAFGSTNTAVSKFRFSATNEDFVITGAKLIIETAASSRSVEKVILTYPKDAAGNLETKEGYLTSGAVTFSDGSLNIYVKKDSYAVLTVKVNLNSKSAGATNEDAIRIGLDKVANDWTNNTSNLTNDFIAVGQSSGAKLYGNTNNITMNNYTLNKAYAMESYPTVALASDSPSGNLVPGTNTLVAKFNITAHANNDVTFESGDSNQLVVKFSVSGASTSSTVTLTDGTNTLCSDTVDFTASSPSFTCDFSSNSLTVPAGQTKTVYLYVDTLTAGLTTSGEGIQAYLDDNSDNNIKFGVNGSGNYAYGTIIFRGKIYGGSLVRP
jgi:hypothetical protein